MGLRGTTTTSLSTPGNYRNDSIWIDSVILSEQTHGCHWRTYLLLIKLIMKALCLPVRASNIPVILHTIKISERYRGSWSLLLLLMLLAIQLRSKLKMREGDLIGWLGVISIGGYLMEIYLWTEFSGTAMAIRFSLGGGPNNVNRMTVNALHCIMKPSLLTIDIFALVVVFMFSVWIVH